MSAIERCIEVDSTSEPTHCHFNGAVASSTEPRLKYLQEVASSLTLYSRLGSSGGNGAHGADHEVSEQQVGARRGLGRVVAPVGDLAASGLALERAGVGAGGSIAQRRRGAQGADGGEAVAGCSRSLSRKSARCNCERRHGDGVEGSIGSLKIVVKLEQKTSKFPSSSGVSGCWVPEATILLSNLETVQFSLAAG